MPMQGQHFMLSSDEMPLWLAILAVVNLRRGYLSIGAEAEDTHESDDDVAPVPRAKRVKSRGRGRGFRL